MYIDLMISGFGGQGVLIAGRLLSYAAMRENRYVTFFPAYGPVMRGGEAYCTVVISTKPIASPVVRSPLTAIVMNLPSLLSLEPRVKSGGLLIVNSDLAGGRATPDLRNTASEVAGPLPTCGIPHQKRYSEEASHPPEADRAVFQRCPPVLSSGPHSKREDIKKIFIPANTIAERVGSGRVASMVALGSYIEATRVVPLDTAIACLDKIVTEKHKEFLRLDEEALNQGAEFVKTNYKLQITNLKF